jgi:hypothetical protein
MKPRQIGTINGYVTSPMRIGRRRGTFDGTIKGLTLAALDMGATVGATVYADFGAGMQPYLIVAAPHDDRARGCWAERKGTRQQG